MPVINMQHQRGVLLLEILITVVILSVGLLGLAAMQLQGTQSNHSAYLRSQASFLSYDILDRMRSNRSLALNMSSYAINMSDPAPTSTTNCAAASCNSSEMALFDMSEWKQATTSILPSGNGEIFFTAAAAGSPIVNINIQWQDSRKANAPLHNFIFRAEL